MEYVSQLTDEKMPADNGEIADGISETKTNDFNFKNIQTGDHSHQLAYQLDEMANISTNNSTHLAPSLELDFPEEDYIEIEVSSSNSESSNSEVQTSDSSEDTPMYTGYDSPSSDTTLQDKDYIIEDVDNPSESQVNIVVTPCQDSKPEIIPDDNVLFCEPHQQSQQPEPTGDAPQSESPIYMHDENYLCRLPGDILHTSTFPASRRFSFSSEECLSSSTTKPALKWSTPRISISPSSPQDPQDTIELRMENQQSFQAKRDALSTIRKVCPESYWDEAIMEFASLLNTTRVPADQETNSNIQLLFRCSRLAGKICDSKEECKDIDQQIEEQMFKYLEAETYEAKCLLPVVKTGSEMSCCAIQCDSILLQHQLIALKEAFEKLHQREGNLDRRLFELRMAVVTGAKDASQSKELLSIKEECRQLLSEVEKLKNKYRREVSDAPTSVMTSPRDFSSYSDIYKSKSGKQVQGNCPSSKKRATPPFVGTVTCIPPITAKYKGDNFGDLNSHSDSTSHIAPHSESKSDNQQ